MTDKTTLGDRMKEYEATTKLHLLRRTPVIIRIDGRAFHTFTKQFSKLDSSMKDSAPFSKMIHRLMVETASVLFEQVQNSVLVYTQSDEISLLLTDWDRHETQQWFGANVQKMVSVSASIATAAFNAEYQAEVSLAYDRPCLIKFNEMATFDSRVYNLPKEEVVNYFIWRQQDASRNSVQMLGHHHFSQKEMHAKNNSQVQDMLMLDKGVNWNDFATWMKRGTCIRLNPEWNQWQSFQRTQVDEEIPIFTQDRAYIQKLLEVEDINE